MEELSTAYWAQKFKEWWEEIGSKQKRARYPKDLKQGYLDAYKKELASGQKTTKISIGGKSASIELRGSGPGDNLKVVYDATRTVKSGKRRASTKGGAYTFEEMFEYHKQLFPDAPDEDIAVLTHRHMQVNKEELKLRANIKGENIIREHRNPISNVEGAGEYYRNIPPDDKAFNAWKSNKIPSKEYLERVGIGSTRFETIQRGLSSPYPRIGLEEDRRLIRQDLGAPERFNVIPELEVKSAAGQEALEFLGGTAKFKRTAGSVLPLVGVAAGVMSAGQAFAAGDPREGTARLLETGAGEIPVIGDIVQPESVAGGTFEDVERRTAEGIRAKQLQQRATEARQRGGKLSFGIGSARFTLPEFDLSELMGIN